VGGVDGWVMDLGLGEKRVFPPCSNFVGKAMGCIAGLFPGKGERRRGIDPLGRSNGKRGSSSRQEGQEVDALGILRSARSCPLCSLLSPLLTSD
jgi:hypothetical protein